MSREIKVTCPGSHTLRAKGLIQAGSPAHLLEAQHFLALEQEKILKELLTRPVADYMPQERRASGGRG